MPELFELTSIFFAVFLLYCALTWLSLWEEKEYSLRRVLIHIKETKRGRNLFFGPSSFIKWALIFVYAITIVSNAYDLYYHIAVSVFYLLSVLFVLQKIYNRDIKLPTFSIINLLVFFATALLITLLYVFSPLDKFLWLLMLDKLLPLFIALFVGFFSVFYDFGTDVVINKAISKINNRKNLLTVAVVGSYGRGSTKEFIAKMLSLKFNVLETKTSFNNALGIARTINKDLTAKKQIFLADMDDYKRGDISDMANIVRPSIAVVCGINEQKMSTFGSFDQIISSKYEIVDNLSTDGIVIFNANNKYSMKLYKKTPRKKFTYKVGEGGQSADIYATNIKESKHSVSFDVVVRGRRYVIKDIKLLGRQNIENILPAIFIGAYVGIDFSKMRTVLKALRPLPGTMNPKMAAGNITLIDDTYRANINSVLKALSYMRLYKGKRIMVLEPLLELGKFAEKDHYSLGVEIGKVCSHLFLTNDNYFKSVARGVNASGKCKVSVMSPSMIIKFIKKNCKKDDVVMFEGREANLSLSLLKPEPIYE